MTSRLRTIKDLVTRLHRDEKGAEGLEKLLIVGAIVLPLLGVLIIFRDKISEWVSDKWGDVQSDADTDPPTP